MDANEVLTYLSSLYEEAKPRFLSLSPKAIKRKSANDILTDADLAMNEFFVSRLSSRYPEARLIAEESENPELGEGWTFVVDPLDGTCNYALGLPLCGIQIALFHDQDPVASLIGLPLLDELYLAAKGAGATRNGNPLRLDSCVKAKDGILALSDFYEDGDLPLAKQYEAVASLRSKFLKTRLFGASCFDFACLASSKAQAYFCQYHCLWDVAPGYLLCLEAGAVSCGLGGKPYRFGDHTLLLANSPENLALLREAAKAA